MISEITFFGDAKYSSIGSNLTLKSGDERMQGIAASAGSLVVALPDARELNCGGPLFYIGNLGETSFDIEDDASGSIAAVATAKMATLFLMDNSTAAGSWLVTVTDLVGGPYSTLVTFAAPLAVAAIHDGNLTTSDERHFVGTLTAASDFTGDFQWPESVTLGGSLSADTVFVGDFASYPATKVVSPTATGGGTGAVGDPWTVAEAADNLSAGETAYLRGGAYGTAAKDIIDTINAAVTNGTSGNVIKYEAYPGETPVITGTFTIMDAEYMEFIGLSFETSGTAWVTTRTAANLVKYIEFTNCTFSCNPGSLSSYTGFIFYYGDHITFDGCKFNRWYPGDMLRIYYSDEILFTDCDFSEAWATHNVVGVIDSSNLVIENCRFRNEWDRCFTIRQVTSSGPTLVQNCTFLDCDWDGISPGPGDEYTSWAEGSTDVTRHAGDRIICRNNIYAGCNGGKANRDYQAQFTYDYSSAWQITLHDHFYQCENLRMYNCVLHDNKLNNLAMVHSALVDAPIETTSCKWKNCSITEGYNYNLRICNDDFDWNSWLFDTCRIHHTTVSKSIYIAGAPTIEMTVAEAEAAHGHVFISNLATAPSYYDLSVWQGIEADPSTYTDIDLSTIVDSFKEGVAGDGHGAGTYLAKVTSGGTSATINVDDAYWFWATSDLKTGDSILIGGNNAVTVTAINSATQIVVSSSITVNTDDEIYLELMTTSPDVGVYSILGTSKTFGGALTSASAHAGILTLDLTLAGATTIASAHTGDFTTSDYLFTLTHEDNDWSEYDNTPASDLSVSGAAAMDSTSYGVAVLYDDISVKYGQKDFTDSTDYIRYRIYFNVNTLATTSSYSTFNMIECQSAANSIRGVLQLNTRNGSDAQIRAQVRDDLYSLQSTSFYDVTSGDHYIEVEVMRASSDVASDGTLKLWLDGALKETVTGVDLYDLSRSAKFLIGMVRNLGADITGTYYYDEIIGDDTSTIIGA